MTKKLTNQQINDRIYIALFCTLGGIICGVFAAIYIIQFEFSLALQCVGLGFLILIPGIIVMMQVVRDKDNDSIS